MEIIKWLIHKIIVSDNMAILVTNFDFLSTCSIHSFFYFFLNLSECWFVTHNRECYEWICKIRWDIQVGRLSFRGNCLWFSSFIFFMSVYVTYSNISVINSRWWRCPLPSSLSLAMPHPNSWLDTQFVL